MKIYVAAVEALKKKERQDETQFTTKIDGILSSNILYPYLMKFHYFVDNNVKRGSQKGPKRWSLYKYVKNVNQILACESLFKVSTLANSSLIILFSEMFKFSKIIFFQIKKYCEGE